MRSLGNIAPNEEFRCQDSQKPRIKWMTPDDKAYLITNAYVKMTSTWKQKTLWSQENNLFSFRLHNYK
jgi:hypothetical protein